MIFKNKRLCIIVIVMCISMINGMDKSTENYEPDLYIDETNKNIFQNYVYDANYSDDEDDEKSQNYPGIEKEQNIPASTKRTINDKNPTNKKTNYVERLKQKVIESKLGQAGQKLGTAGLKLGETGVKLGKDGIKLGKSGIELGKSGIELSKKAYTGTKDKIKEVPGKIFKMYDDISDEYNYEFKTHKAHYLKEKATDGINAVLDAPRNIKDKARQVKNMFQEKMPRLFEQAANKIRKQPLPQVEIIITCDEKDDQPITINRSTNFKKLVLKDCTINYADIAEYLKTNKTLEELDLTDVKSDYRLYLGNEKIIRSLLSNTTLTSLKISLATEIYIMQLKWIIQYVAAANSKRIKTKKYLDVTINTDCNLDCVTYIKNDLNQKKTIGNISLESESEFPKLTLENGGTITIISN